jgi:ent-kaurene synthase
MMTETKWQITQYVPTVEEYMTNGVVSFALGPIVLPALYFVGEKISECVFKDQEHSELFRVMSTCGRLLNDIQGFEVCGPPYDKMSVNFVVSIPVYKDLI